MAKKSLSAQHIANAFPLWSDIRKDEQSLGRQFLNHVGNRMDDLREQLQKLGDNLYLSTSCVSDIDIYYSVRLPDSFDFEKTDSDDTEWIFTPPTVSGLADGQYYSVSLAEENSLENFWYNSVPSRVTCETTASGACLLASGVMQYGPIPLIIASGIVDPPNKLYVTVSGNGSYIYVDDENFVSRTIVQVEGLTRPGGEVTEELYFVHADTLRTRNDFQRVDEIRCYYTPYNTTASVKIEMAGFNQIDHPAAYQFAKNEYKENITMFWGIGDGYLTGQKTLDVRKYDADEVLDRIAGYADRHPFMSFELLDEDGNYINAIDCAVEPHSKRVWVVDSGALYLFDADLYYPNTQTMVLRNYDASSVIEPSSYHIIPGETVTLWYVWKRPVSEIQAYRIWVIKPDGTKKSIVDGSEAVYSAGVGSWQGGPLMANRNIQHPDDFVLTEAGDHTYCLEVKYADGTKSLDKKVISVLSKTALGQFNLRTATEVWEPITGISLDSEYKIWVQNSNLARFQIRPRYDNMIIDWKRKVIYFREPYTQVRVLDYVS